MKRRQEVVLNRGEGSPLPEQFPSPLGYPCSEGQVRPPDAPRLLREIRRHHPMVSCRLEDHESLPAQRRLSQEKGYRLL